MCNISPLPIGDPVLYLHFMPAKLAPPPPAAAALRRGSGMGWVWRLAPEGLPIEPVGLVNQLAYSARHYGRPDQNPRKNQTPGEKPNAPRPAKANVRLNLGNL
jgi:hypothetical protein